MKPLASARVSRAAREVPVPTLLLLSLATPALAAERPADLDALIVHFEQVTGVDLHVMGDPSDPDGTIPTTMGPVDPFLAATALPHLEEVLLQYPKSIRGGLLQDLHLFGKFQPGGKPYNGMSRPDYFRIDLALRSRTSMASLQSTLHHEIGHLIEFDDAFPRDAWVALSAGYAGRLDKQPETKGQDREVWLAQGFVSRYASKNRHEDFAELAQAAFTRPNVLVGWADSFPALGAKVDLMTEVYHDAAPGMNLPWTPADDATATPPTPSPPVATAPPDEPLAKAPPRRGRARRGVDNKGNPR
jgi:hypothetical protein